MCHVPPGNSGNAHTICIDESAVAAHLAHGCSLGSCDEQNDCLAQLYRTSDSEIGIRESSVELVVSPNPFTDNIIVELSVKQEGMFNVMLVNSYGQVIQEVFQGDLKESDLNRYTINTQELGGGIYFLRTSDADGVVVLYKIIKI